MSDEARSATQDDDLDAWVLDDSKWIDDYNENTTSPVHEPHVGFVTWWEDMRPSEVRRLVKQAYVAGVKRGIKACR